MLNKIVLNHVITSETLEDKRDNINERTTMITLFREILEIACIFVRRYKTGFVNSKIQQENLREDERISFIVILKRRDECDCQDRGRCQVL